MALPRVAMMDVPAISTPGQKPPAHDAPPPGSPTAKRLRLTAWLLFVSLLALYEANDAIVEEGDAVANLGVPMALLRHGKLSFTPETHPQMFDWRTKPPMHATDQLYIRSWHAIVDDDFAYRWRDKGKLEPGEPRYFVVESTEHPGTYVSTFGPIPGLMTVPMMGAFALFDDRFDEKTIMHWSIAKLHAAAMVAATGAFLFLLATHLCSYWSALLLALAFGVGTSVWTVLSQTLWQQTVNIFFLSLSLLFLVVRPSSRRNTFLAGLAMGAAFACRHTSLLILAPMGLYMLWRQRDRVIPFALGVMPLPLFEAAYNTYYFGSPINFGQELIGHSIALAKTGSPDIWQTPIWEGFAGLMFSPSRGVMVFSPFLVLAGWGLVRIWRRPGLAWLRPISVGVLAIMAMQCKWFDWWGGWSYGYRPWLDAVPFLVLFIAPVMNSLMRRDFGQIAFGLALGWSIAIQALGAFAYDKYWNARHMFLVETGDGERELVPDSLAQAQGLAFFTNGRIVTDYPCNIDEPPCRYRLWSLEDNMLLYYVRYYTYARHNRWKSGWRQLKF